VPVGEPVVVFGILGTGIGDEWFIKCLSKYDQDEDQLPGDPAEMLLFDTKATVRRERIHFRN
jgi:hypothetical protein